MQAIQTYKHKKQKNKILEIFYDENPESPREWDNLGIIYAKHPRYTLSDKNASIEDLEQAMKTGIVLNIFMYEHSGVSLSTTNQKYPFSDLFDSGQVGYIYATRETILKEYSKKRISKKVRELAERVLRSEIETFSQYINGECFGFIVSKIKKCNLEVDHNDTLDSCWGFYGSDFDKNGLFDNLGKKDDWIEQ